MFAIGIQSEPKSLDAFKKTFHIKFPILPDQQLDVFTKLGEPAIPFLMLVDQQGKVLLTHKGYLKDGDDFFRKIRSFSTH
jgi:peroxiredoxin